MIVNDNTGLQLASGVVMSRIEDVSVYRILSDKIRSIVGAWPCYYHPGYIGITSSYPMENDKIKDVFYCACGEEMVIISDRHGDVLGVESMKHV